MKSCPILAQITSIDSSLIYYLSCKLCRSKVIQQNQGYMCANCNNVEPPVPHYRFSLEIYDGTLVANVVVFGNAFNKFFGTNASQFIRWKKYCLIKHKLSESQLNKLISQNLKNYFINEWFYFKFDVPNIHHSYYRLDDQFFSTKFYNLKRIKMSKNESKSLVVINLFKAGNVKTFDTIIQRINLILKKRKERLLKKFQSASLYTFSSNESISRSIKISNKKIPTQLDQMAKFNQKSPVNSYNKLTNMTITNFQLILQFKQTIYNNKFFLLKNLSNCNDTYDQTFGIQLKNKKPVLTSLNNNNPSTVHNCDIKKNYSCDKFDLLHNINLFENNDESSDNCKIKNSDDVEENTGDINLCAGRLNIKSVTDQSLDLFSSSKLTIKRKSFDASTPLLPNCKRQKFTDRFDSFNRNIMINKRKNKSPNTFICRDKKCKFQKACNKFDNVSKNGKAITGSNHIPLSPIIANSTIESILINENFADNHHSSSIIFSNLCRNKMDESISVEDEIVKNNLLNLLTGSNVIDKSGDLFD